LSNGYLQLPANGDPSRKTEMDIENTAASAPVKLTERGITLLPTPSPTIHLKTLDDVRVEMAKVYRNMKLGKVPCQDGTRLVYVLSQIGRVIEADQIAGRVDAIERTLRLRGKS
jgi:hypothetical protein